MVCRSFGIPCPAIGELDYLSSKKGEKIYLPVDGDVDKVDFGHIFISIVDLSLENRIGTCDGGHSSSQGHMATSKRAEE